MPDRTNISLMPQTTGAVAGAGTSGGLVAALFALVWPEAPAELVVAASAFLTTLGSVVSMYIARKVAQWFQEYSRT